MISGKNPFISIPEWFIGNNSLELCENLEYLGGFIGNSCNNVHVNVRKAFYALQSAGLINKGLDVETADICFQLNLQKFCDIWL